MHYIFLALFTYTAAILVGTLASRKLNAVVLSAIVNSVSAIVPIVLAYPFITRSALPESRYGIALGVLGGILIAIFTIALNKSYALHKVAIVSPIVFGGAIVLSSILGTILFKERLSYLEMSGLSIVACGIGIIIYAKITAS